MPISKLLWGTGFENEVRIGYPLFDVVTDREEREGSEHIQAPSGVEDAWITGRDYTLDTEVRWIPDGPNTSPVQTPLSGPVSWQEFLDWARDANAFRFVPDENVPDFYVDSVRLVEPRKGFGSLSTDIKRNVRLKLRNPTVDFHQALRGLMFEYAPGMSLTDPVAATFTRATAATRRGLPGNLAAAIGATDASGVLRDRHYEGTLKTTLLEAARTQRITDPDNFGAWSQIGSPVLTSGQADPFGGTAAYLVNDDVAGDEAIYQNITNAGNGLAVFVKADNGANQRLRVTDITAGDVTRHQVGVSWASGVPTLTTQTGAGNRYAPENWGAGWWRILFSANGVLSANTNRLELYPAAGGATGEAYFFRANNFDDVIPGSPQGPSLVVRNADVFTWPFTHKPQPMFRYNKFVERGTILSVSGTRLLQIGRDAVPEREWITYQSGGKYRSYHQHGPVSVFAEAAAAPVIGDVVEHLDILFPDGSVKLIQAINGGVEVTAGPSGANANGVPVDWGLQSLFFNDKDGGGVPGFNAFARTKVGPLTFAGITRDTIAKARAV